MILKIFAKSRNAHCTYTITNIYFSKHKVRILRIISKLPTVNLKKIKRDYQPTLWSKENLH